MVVNEYTQLYTRYGELMVQKELAENEINQVKAQIQQLINQPPPEPAPKGPETPEPKK